MLAEAADRLPDVRVRARQESTGVLSDAVATGELDLALGFCAEPRPGVICERLSEEPAVVAVGASHRLASRRAVWLRELRTETFALVDARDGPGFNRAVIALCEQAGFEPDTASDPRGPMAWESAVRLDGHVGLTARSAAVSSARNLRLIELRDEFTFALQFVRPALPLAALRPVARAFRALGRELAARGF